METSSGLSVPITTPERESTFAFELQPREWGREREIVCASVVCAWERKCWSAYAPWRENEALERERVSTDVLRGEKRVRAVLLEPKCVCVCACVLGREKERECEGKWKGSTSWLAALIKRVVRPLFPRKKKLHLRCCCRVAAAVNFGNLVLILLNLVPDFLPRITDPMLEYKHSDLFKIVTWLEAANQNA